MKEIPLEPKDADLVRAFGALGSPARFKILVLLAERPESIVADLVARLPLAQATVSQHLTVLQEAGLVFDERAGISRCCRVDADRLLRFARQVLDWSHQIALRATSCGPSTAPSKLVVVEDPPPGCCK